MNNTDSSKGGVGGDLEDSELHSKSKGFKSVSAVSSKRKKLQDIKLLWRAKHYAVLTADSEEEISWAIEALRKADEVAHNG